MTSQEFVLARGRIGASPLRFAFVAACAVLLTVGVSGRTPSAFSDSNSGMLDTRIGTAFAVGEYALDTRTGSLATSDLRGLNTTKIGICINFR